MLIDYEEDSFCGQAFEEEIDEVLDVLNEEGYVVDQSYFEHIQEFNGGIPVNKYFRHGEIERFLNFSDSYTTGARFKDLNVNWVRHLIKDFVLPNVYPFASLPHGAFLCFMYSTDSPPSVVMWNNEAYSEKYEHAANSFTDLVLQLRDTT